MTACTLKEILPEANRNKRAVAGVVVLGWEDAVAYVQAAEEVGCPLILQAGPGARAHTPVQAIGPMMRHLSDTASVPVAVHLDHGKAYDECVEAIDFGFTSIMFDGSSLPLDENIEISARLAEAAKAAGVSLEGEVGFVGYAEGARSTVTDPLEVARFEKETGVDALAVSVGNVHLQTEKSDGIDFEALAAIEAVTTVPLVIHGASGIPAGIRKRMADETQVAKFNIGTEFRMTFGAELRKSIAAQPDAFDRIKLLEPTIAPLRKKAIEVFQQLHRPKD